MDKMKQNVTKVLARRPVRYLVAGGLTALTEYLSFVLLTFLDINIILANALSFILSLFVGFTLNKRWVFASVGDYKKQVSGYITLAYINLGLSSLIIWALTSMVVIDPLVAKIITMVLIACSNYLIFSRLIFKASNK